MLRRTFYYFLFFQFLFVLFQSLPAQDFLHESKAAHDARMKWWREARFGMFIHWGLYSIPAGEWKGKTEYGEWIRTSAEIPLEEYDKFIHQFNPVKFNVAAWVRMAKNAGMKYIVITSKHHDGFCLFDSKYTHFDVMSTPFKRDIMKELADACRKEGMKICWYHSIMDWHHPDYLPRREWEKNRSASGANFNRYIEYLKNELKELLTNYGDISVLWFDGEWESTWKSTYGKEIYNYVRSLQPNIIINNRIIPGRSGMEEFTDEGELGGDFGTPEQQIPPTGIPGVDWETCMTMNDHWGYNRNDKHFKSAKEIIRMLADIVSKGGNYLLNIGPTAEGLFPEESVQRLKEIGRWMKINHEAIYETQASPFSSLSWGRCTKKVLRNGNTRLYMHVFDIPKDGRLVINNLANNPAKAYLLNQPSKKLYMTRNEDALVITLPTVPPDTIDAVIALDFKGEAIVYQPPVIIAPVPVFLTSADVGMKITSKDLEIHYTTDGTVPTQSSPKYVAPVHIIETTVLKVRSFYKDRAVSEIVEKKIEKVKAISATDKKNLTDGLWYEYFEGDWDVVPDFDALKVISSGTTSAIDLKMRKQEEKFGVRFLGYIDIPIDDVYTFSLGSDDGSKFFVGERLVVDNDQLHPMVYKEGYVPLAKGFHPLTITYFNKTGGLGLELKMGTTEKKPEIISEKLLRH